MPKDFFSVSRTTSLHSLKAGAKIHVIGVCGVAMAQLSVALTERGFVVSGSDKEFYEPMKSLLAKSAVQTKTGYQKENVPSDADLVVIGNAISYGNPEVDVVEEKGLPYTLFPKILQEVAIAGKHSIVVTGTHGKSTTTALIATLLLQDSKDPSYFVGGIAQALPQSLAVGKGGFSVVEGDEYDSAFFAKVPKFSFYTPDTVVVNAIEYDHADIYASVEVIEQEFTKLVTGLPKTGTAICCIDFPRVKKLVSEWKETAQCEILTFGADKDADFVIVERETTGFSQKVTVSGPGLGGCTFELPMVGEYNARNALAAIVVSQIVGMELGKVVEYLAQFKAVKRRQEVRARENGVVLIEDFAHHPTAVAQTVEAIREAFPSARLWAVFEPRSNSSRRKVFQEEYIKAFKKADYAILKNVQARASDSGLELIDVRLLSESIAASGVSSVCLDDVNAIRDFLWKEIPRTGSDSNVRDVIFVMSNGSFDGLNELLQKDLLERGASSSAC
jgi:UDP-N-acetylmuramate: L-alanyl-gamma-D-glutamyl-meso-diaminopimelate ligase